MTATSGLGTIASVGGLLVLRECESLLAMEGRLPHLGADAIAMRDANSCLLTHVQVKDHHISGVNVGRIWYINAVGADDVASPAPSDELKFDFELNLRSPLPE
jgi:hypothetical protein